MTEQEYFERQDQFVEFIIKYYDNDVFKETLRPYIDWKRGDGPKPTRLQALEIMAAIDTMQNIHDELSTILQILN